MSRLYLIGIVFLLNFSVYGQNKVLQFLNFGDEKFQKGDFVNALDYYKQALDLDSNAVAINWKYAEALKAYKDYEKAAKYFGIVYQKEGTKIYQASLINYALMVKQTGDYDQAITLFKKAKTIYANDKKSYFYLKSKRELEACLWAKSTCNLTAECITTPLPSSINTENSEFGHSISNGIFYFSSLRADSINSKEEVFTPNYTTSLFQSKQAEGSFEESKKITSLVAANINVGNGSFSLDKTRFYFSICKNDNFNYACKIAVANYQDGVWSSVDTLGEIINATGANTTMPHIANWNGIETLFFASDREGTEGGMDIWYSQLKNGNQFSKVRSIKEINTVDNDLCPWWDEKSNTLYFSSAWYNGFGGLDIFKSTYNNQFGAPENIGKPFNSSANDLYYFQHQDTAYFSSNRKGVKYSKNPTCCSDVFSVVPFRKDTTDTTTGIVAIETFETLMKRLPVTLYFHNDVPNPKSIDTTTTLNYLTTYAEYTKLLSTYQEEYSEGLIPEKAQIAKEEIESFFIEYVDQGVKDLTIFSDLLFKELEKGIRIQLVIKGFASPLAKSDYNVKLTKRRITSLKNYLYELENGKFSIYIKNGSLQFKEVPFGENKANKMTSDNFHDQKNSVYSKAAAIERKIEIISIERLKN